MFVGLVIALCEAGNKNIYTMIDGFEVDKEESGDHEGARVVDGWKNSGLPWARSWMRRRCTS